jgi:hypothetical protein
VVAEEKSNARLKRKKHMGISLLKKRLAPVILERKSVRTVFFEGFPLVKDGVLPAGWRQRPPQLAYPPVRCVWDVVFPQVVPVVVRLAVVARPAPVVARVARIHRGLEIGLAKCLHVCPVGEASSV